MTGPSAAVLRGRLEALATSTAIRHAGNLMNRMDYLTEIIETAEALRAATVDEAREHGASWAEIGQACGLSKQGAQQRWGRRPATPPEQHTEPLF